MNPRQVQLKVDFSSAKSNWTVKIASNSNWTAILASQLQLKLDFCTANSNWRLKIAGRSGRRRTKRTAQVERTKRATLTRQAKQATLTRRTRRAARARQARRAARARLYFGMSITRLIVLVLCICAGLAKIANAYVVQTHDTKEL